MPGRQQLQKDMVPQEALVAASRWRPLHNTLTTLRPAFTNGSPCAMNCHTVGAVVGCCSSRHVTRSEWRRQHRTREEQETRWRRQLTLSAAKIRERNCAIFVNLRAVNYKSDGTQGLKV